MDGPRLGHGPQAHRLGLYPLGHVHEGEGLFARQQGHLAPVPHQRQIGVVHGHRHVHLVFEARPGPRQTAQAVLKLRRVALGPRHTDHKDRQTTHADICVSHDTAPPCSGNNFRQAGQGPRPRILPARPMRMRVQNSTEMNRTQGVGKTGIYRHPHVATEVLRVPARTRGGFVTHPLTPARRQHIQAPHGPYAPSPVGVGSQRTLLCPDACEFRGRVTNPPLRDPRIT